MTEIKEGNNSPKYGGKKSGVTIFNLCKVAGHALYLYQVS